MEGDGAKHVKCFDLKRPMKADHHHYIGSSDGHQTCGKRDAEAPGGYDEKLN